MFFPPCGIFSFIENMEKDHKKNNYVKCTYFDYLYYNTKYRYILHVRRNENLIWIKCANVEKRKEFFLYPQDFRDVICKRLVWRAADVGHNFTEICKMTREKRDSRILHAKFLSKSFPKSLKWFRKKKFIIRQART